MRAGRYLRAAALMGVLAILPACSGAPSTENPIAGALPSGVAEITITSDGFESGGAIPSHYTCDDDDEFPGLAWSGVPDDAVAVAVFVEDPDAPNGAFTHWMVADLPPGTTAVDTGEPADGVVGANDAGGTGWTGPCPPEDDDAHRYVFTVVALDAPTGLDPGFAPDDLVAAVEGHVVGLGTLIATYDR